MSTSKPGAADVCGTIWKKISNARLRRQLDEEAALKLLARTFGCGVRPASVPHQLYPEVDEVPTPVPPPFSESWYRIGFMACSADPGGVYSEAGTDDPVDAAAWYVENSAAGDESGRRGLFQGCYDALTGQTNLLDSEGLS